ncbi:MAG: gliding motility-associated C-terminal domain-containing protein [Flavobacterium sp.]|nr:gliding motility-associated C-terminal domain-containing protein [Flavobacterium sp.]
MKKTITYVCYFLLLCIFLLPTAVRAQLGGFTLTVTAINESCPGNGSLNFTSTGVTPGATVLYNVYKHPDLTTPIATLAANSLGALSAGTYRVIAVQSLGGQSSSEQQDVVINNIIAPLQFGITVTGCSGNTTLSVTVTQGSASSYEIFSGPVTFPAQPTSSFNPVPNGNYQIRVFDACGEAVVQSYTVSTVESSIAIAAGTTTSGALQSCDSILTANLLTPAAGALIQFPLTLEYTIYPPSGAPIVVSQTVNSGIALGMSVVQVIPFYHDQAYSYDLKVTDGCGNVFVRNTNIINERMKVILSAVPKLCTKALRVTLSRHRPPFTVNFISAPAGFDPVVFNAAYPGPFTSAEFYNPSVAMPAGTYVVEVTDACGRTATSQIQFDPTPPTYPIPFQHNPTCGDEMGTITAIIPNSSAATLMLTSAPAGYPHSLPQDVSGLVTDGSFLMIPELFGVYTFQTTDDCNNAVVSSVQIAPLDVTSNVEVTENCNSFELFVSHSAAPGPIYGYFLQKYYPLTGTWGHPGTGVSAGNIPDETNALLLSQNTVITNLTFFGTFRILRMLDIGELNEDCVEEVHSFEYDGVPAINAIFPFACSGNSFDVIIDADGAGPLLYRITAQNGMPFLIQNGTSNIFLNLAPAIYNFQVEDTCGNILNRLYDVSESFEFPITATQICPGADGSLSVPYFSFLIYEWWKGDDMANILSTSATLSFSPFNVSADAGMYHVRITSSNGLLACIDFTVDYEILSNFQNANAGNDNSVSICGDPGQQNLFDLITGPYDVGGVWTNLSTNEVIADGLWQTNGTFGSHSFDYTVTSTCGAPDSSTIAMMLNPIPDAPVAYIDGMVCQSQDILLFADGPAENQYEWSGPNGFSSTLQNPVIPDANESHSGIYSVKTTINGCESDLAEVDVQIIQTPDLEATGNCVNGQYVLTATSPDGIEGADFEWTGPANFTAVGNQVVVSGLPSGEYLVTAMFDTGCEKTASVFVNGTVCQIPQGVSVNNDGFNDTFNLTGMNVEMMKIFNRYGMVVFEQQQYTDEWRGQSMNGSELPTATYYYYVRLAGGIEKTGWVYLIR